MELFRPAGTVLEAADVARFLSNFEAEIDGTGFTSAERRALVDVRILGRMLDVNWRPFFLYHFTAPILRTANAMFAMNRTPTLLELGCGSGTISLLFALMGANVLAVDLDPVLLSACRKRQREYERHFGPLNIEFRLANVFDLEYDAMQVDGVYSIYAFNLMQPSRELIPRVTRALKLAGKLAITEGNRLCLYNRLFRRRPVLSLPQLEAELARCGCRVEDSQFDCALAPIIVRNEALFAAGKKMERAADALGLLRWLGLSYNLVAQKNGVPSSAD